MKKATYLKGLLVLSLAVMLYGCLDEIDLEIPKGTEEKIVIQGKLVKGNPSVAEVSVTRLFDFTSASRRRLTMREVRLLDEAGRSIELERSDLSEYRAVIFPNDPEFTVETGQSYQLRVVTLDNRVYESTLEPLLATPEPSELRAEIVQKEVEQDAGEFTPRDFFRFYISSPLSTTESSDNVRLRWETVSTYRVTDSPDAPGEDPKTCYVTQTVGIQQVEILDGTTTGASEITDYVVLDEQLGALFAEGYYLSVFQEALSAGAFEYYEELNNLIERSGSIFEPPAGKISTNFRNINDPSDEAFGYFYASQPKVVRIYISPEFAGNPTTLCPPNLPMAAGGGCALPPCCNCLDAGEESTLVRPPFWVE